MAAQSEIRSAKPLFLKALSVLDTIPVASWTRTFPYVERDLEGRTERTTVYPFKTTLGPLEVQLERVVPAYSKDKTSYRIRVSHPLNGASALITGGEDGDDLARSLDRKLDSSIDTQEQSRGKLIPDFEAALDQAVNPSPK